MLNNNSKHYRRHSLGTCTVLHTKWWTIKHNKRIMTNWNYKQAMAREFRDDYDRSAVVCFYYCSKCISNSEKRLKCHQHQIPKRQHFHDRMTMGPRQHRVSYFNHLRCDAEWPVENNNDCENGEWTSAIVDSVHAMQYLNPLCGSRTTMNGRKSEPTPRPNKMRRQLIIIFQSVW